MRSKVLVAGLITVFLAAEAAGSQSDNLILAGHGAPGMGPGGGGRAYQHPVQRYGGGSPARIGESADTLSAGTNRRVPVEAIPQPEVLRSPPSHKPVGAHELPPRQWWTRHSRAPEVTSRTFEWRGYDVRRPNNVGGAPVTDQARRGPSPRRGGYSRSGWEHGRGGPGWSGHARNYPGVGLGPHGDASRQAIRNRQAPYHRRLDQSVE